MIGYIPGVGGLPKFFSLITCKSHRWPWSQAGRVQTSESHVASTSQSVHHSQKEQHSIK